MRDSDSFHFRRLAALKTPWNRFRIFPGLWEPFRKVALLSEAWHRGFPRLLRCTRNLLCAKRMIKSCVPLGMVPLSKDFTLGYFAPWPPCQGAFYECGPSCSGYCGRYELLTPFPVQDGRNRKRHAAHSRFRTNPEGTAFSVLTCGLTWDWVLPGKKKKTPQAVNLRGL